MRNSLISAAIALGSGLLVCTAPASAQVGLLASDGFDAGSVRFLAGWNGGPGWTSAWVDMLPVGSLPTVIGDSSTGLTYLNLATRPGAVHSQRGELPEAVLIARGFPAPTGDVVYVSALFRPDADMSTFYGISVGSYAFGLSPLPGQTNYGMLIGNTVVSTAEPATPGQTIFLVTEMRHDVAANTTVYSMFTNPTPGLPMPAVPAATFTRPNLTAFADSIALQGRGGFTVDEIRIGTTWESVTPVCPGSADFNQSGALSVQDIFDFLNGWFASDPRADFNGQNGITVQDIFDFLAAWFVGCP